jgi:ankyrin repeat protein
MYFAALMFASKNGHLQIVKLLLKLGAKPEAANSSGMTAISFH